MKKNAFLSLLLLAALSSGAQLVNNGGTITVQQGAYLVCTGNLSNTAGTLTNDGRIEVQGNFVNGGTYNSTLNEDSLILSGAGNATLVPGGATINFLSINKAANTDVVTLGGNALVNSKLDYLSGALSTAAYVLSAPKAAVFNFAAGREIAGSVKRTGWSNGAAVLFNSSQMQIATNGGSAPADITVTMLPQANGGDPTQNEREVKRKFLFAQTGGSGFTADVRFPYAATELNTNTEANLVPWTLISSEWNARSIPVTRDAANKWVATTGIDAASFLQEWKLADPKYTFNVTAYLRGSWSGSAMTAAINATLPLSQPYNVTPFSYAGPEAVAAIPNPNVVDWVLVELRKPASGLPADATAATIIGHKAGFLLTNGTVVDLDGVTPIQFDISKQGGAFVVIRHRNHLGVLSNLIPSNTTGSFANNFSALANAYKSPSATSNPLVALPSSAAYGLWAGDANRSGSINGTDVSAIKADITNGNTGYRATDVNLSNSINGTDVSLAKASISSGGGSSAPARMAQKSTTIKTNLPDPVTE